MSGVFYTGTDHRGRIHSYRKGEFFSEPNGVIQKDAGDFGAGVYFDGNKFRASLYGKHIFRVEVDLSKILVIPNPYDERRVAHIASFLFNALFECRRREYPKGKWGWYMQTIHGSAEQRWKASKRVTYLCKEKGYLGIMTTIDHNELVLFSNDPIISFEEVTKPEILAFDILQDKKGYRVKVSNPDLKSYGFEGVIEFVTEYQVKVRFPMRSIWLKGVNVELIE